MPAGPTMNGKRLGAHVKRIRERRGLTQEALAERAGMHRVTVAVIEGGRKIPSIGALERLAKALRVGLPDLLR